MIFVRPEVDKPFNSLTEILFRLSVSTVGIAATVDKLLEILDAAD
jgi:hypothetical protein